ncbi:MAG: hypothetical protein ABFS19_12565 [Thermodesulfobacteriota bacterium]
MKKRIIKLLSLVTLVTGLLVCVPIQSLAESTILSTFIEKSSASFVDTVYTRHDFIYTTGLDTDSVQLNTPKIAAAEEIPTIAPLVDNELTYFLYSKPAADLVSDRYTWYAGFGCDVDSFAPRALVVGLRAQF